MEGCTESGFKQLKSAMSYFTMRKVENKYIV